MGCGTLPIEVPSDSKSRTRTSAYHSPVSTRSERPGLLTVVSTQLLLRPSYFYSGKRSGFSDHCRSAAQVSTDYARGLHHRQSVIMPVSTPLSLVQGEDPCASPVQPSRLLALITYPWLHLPQAQYCHLPWGQVRIPCTEYYWQPGSRPCCLQYCTPDIGPKQDHRGLSPGTV